MHIPKNFLHDKFALLLASTNVFLAFLVIVTVLLRAGVGQGGDGYIVQYRANLGLSAFEKGSFAPIFSFMLFAVVVLVIHMLLSVKTYPLRKALSLSILGLGALVLLLTVIVSNALLALH